MDNYPYKCRFCCDMGCGFCEPDTDVPTPVKDESPICSTPSFREDDGTEIVAF